MIASLDRSEESDFGIVGFLLVSALIEGEVTDDDIRFCFPDRSFKPLRGRVDDRPCCLVDFDLKYITQKYMFERTHLQSCISDNTREIYLTRGHGKLCFSR